MIHQICFFINGKRRYFVNASHALNKKKINKLMLTHIHEKFDFYGNCDSGYQDDHYNASF